MKIQDGRLVAILDFWAGQKSNLTLSLYVPINVTNFKSIAQTLLQILSGIRNSKWLPGSHIRFLIRSKIEHNLRLTCTNKYAKFKINFSNVSCDIERKQKSKMATWWPSWISDRVENQTWPLFNMNQQMCQISNQLLKRFLRYWMEMKIQDGCLAAMLDFWLGPKSNQTLVWYVPINEINFNSIA